MTYTSLLKKTEAIHTALTRILRAREASLRERSLEHIDLVRRERHIVDKLFARSNVVEG